MKLRNLIIALVACMLALWPYQGGATGTQLIAAILSSDQPRYRDAHRAFVKSLASRGYDAGKLEIVLQSPNPDPLSWSNAIRKFNAYKPALIVAYGAPAATVAMKETENIPVVSVDIYGSERTAKVTSGVSSRVPLVTLMKTVASIHPYRKVGVLYTTREIGSRQQADDIRKAAQSFGATTVEANVPSAAALESVLTTLLPKVDLIVVTESSFACRQFDRIVSRATERLIPVISTMPDAADKGALASLEINPQEQGYLAAEVAVRLLEGANHANLPLLTPRRVDLIVNLRVARVLKITLPFQVLGSATRVIK